jgi:radical SAM superfamily enzyme YgiQ (UPF0313 family)
MMTRLQTYRFSSFLKRFIPSKKKHRSIHAIKDSYIDNLAGYKKNRSIDMTLVMAPSWGINMPPLGLEYINASLHHHGFSSLVLDLNIDLFHRVDESLKDYWGFDHHRYWVDPAEFSLIKKLFGEYFVRYAKFILSLNCPIIGFSINAGNRLFTKQLIDKIIAFGQGERPELIVGGPLCRFDKKNQLVVSEFLSVVDMVVVGEGEEVTVEIVSSYKKGEKEPSHPGILLAKETKRPFIPRPPIVNLNDLAPPLYAKETLSQYTENILPVLMSRGCLGRCTFCDGRFFQPKFRTRDPQNVVSELKKHIETTGITGFTFNDLAINWNLGKLEALCDLIIKEDLDIIWNASATIHKGMTETLFKKMASSGCSLKRREKIFGIPGGSLVFGLESGSDKILKLMRKGYTSTDAENVLKMARDAGIATIVNLIVGFPGESDFEFNETLEFIERNRDSIHRLGTLSLCYLPEFSELYTHADSYGIDISKEDPQYHWHDDKGNNLETRKKRAAILLDLAESLSIPPLATTLNYGKQNNTSVHEKANRTSKRDGVQFVCEGNNEKIEASSPGIQLINHKPNGCQPYEKMVDLVLCPPWGIDHPPIGLGSLAKYLSEKEIGYNIFDLNAELFAMNKEIHREFWHVENDCLWRTTDINILIAQLNGFDELVNALAHSTISVIGFSLIDPNQFITCEVIKRIKKHCPGKKIVVGGPVCSTREEREWLQKATQQNIDYIIVGEGEVPLANLLRQLHCPHQTVDIPGVIDCKTKKDDLSSDLEILDLIDLAFPDYEGFDFNLYEAQAAAVLWSRGCISNCTFCKEKAIWERYRHRSVQSILEEIKFYKKRGIHDFVVYDSLVNGKPKFLQKLCESIVAHRLTIRWSALAVPNRQLSLNLLELMKLAGCFVLIFGIESGSEKVLKLMRKNFLLSDAIDVLKRTKAVGIKTAINLITGYPGENEDEFEKTLDFIRDYHGYIDRIDSVTPLQLVHGTYLMNHHAEFGIELPNQKENTHWTTLDGANDFSIRQGRCRKVVELCHRLGIETNKTFL